MFVLKEFITHSGLRRPFKIECDNLTYKDWECLAWIVSNMIGSFGSVEGVPRGGLLLANRLKDYITEGPLLVVDDVFTTGASMEQQRNKRYAKGAVVFARTTPPDWIRSVFLLNTRS